MVKDVVGKGEFVGGAGDGDEVREAQQGDEHQHGLRRFPILLNSQSFSLYFISLQSQKLF